MDRRTYVWYNRLIRNILFVFRGSGDVDKIYAAIDLKSFYASVECVERGLDPLTTNLVVADKSRTEKTICLAVSPSLKSYGISGRPRLFEVIHQVKKINVQRLQNAPGHKFIGQSFYNEKLSDPAVALGYITAPPRMRLYMEYSTRIYKIYLQYFAPEDIHVYSIDEVFIDLSGYLKTYEMEAKQLVSKVITEILKQTGITAAAGIGTNLYLAKVAMDIMAKHVPADENGVRIAHLNEMTYRRQLWNHMPITDFWRIGQGYAKKLAVYQIYTMGDIARCSIGKENEYYNEELLYKLFGINAELLIDHAWGYEPCTIADIKNYKPEEKSIGSGQVLSCAYSTDKAKIVVLEMAEQISYDLFEKGLTAKQVILTVGYDRESFMQTDYKGEIKTDHYGRKVPKHAHGTENFPNATASLKIISDSVAKLYDRIIDKKLLVRRITLSVGKVQSKEDVEYQQLDLFTDYETLRKEQEKEKNLQESLLSIKKKYGKNAILRGISYEEGATTIERNEQIGGHKA